MARYQRYTTFPPGELEACLQEICPGASMSLPASGSTETPRGPRLTTHTFAVTFVDRQRGSCRYERCGARYHRYHYTYVDGVRMPVQRHFERLAGYLPDIEIKGQELAGACYREAIVEERKDYFQRASEPSDKSRKRRPEKFALKPAQAKEWAGRYAVGRFLNGLFSVESVLYDALDKANGEWRKRSDSRLVVACCNRLDRCWEVPKFNPLYADVEMRPEFVGKEAGS